MAHRAGFDPDVVNRVFYDIERWRLLEEPSREDFPPFLVAALNDQLYEGTGQLVLFPRLGLVASAQPHHRVANAHPVTGAHSEIAR